MKKENIRPGAIVTIQGGKYHGHGAKVGQLNHETRKAEVIIAGKLVKLDFERVGL